MPEAISTPSETILIVDDDDEIRALLRTLFELEGYVIAGEARDGLEAVALARLHDPSVVVIDQSMPKMTGDKAAAIIRALCPRARIVAFSAYLTDRPSWADAFLNKERVSEVLPIIGEMLGPERLLPSP
jgi:CheY-like chemotaxis protein